MVARFSVPSRKVVRVLVLAVPILATLIAVIVLLAIVLGWIRDDAVTNGANLALACLCVLIGGLFLVVFHAKRVAIGVPFKNQQTFLTACRQVLEELGYEVSSVSKEQLVSRPSFRALLFGGRIHVSALGTVAGITGPKFFVEILRGRLRLYSHIANVEQSLKDNRHRQGERMLKRVHVSMRLTREQLAEVDREVLGNLAVEGTEVFCTVHIMAQSEQGIRESLIDGELRTWLKQHEIAADIHKDHVRWDEPLPPANLGEPAETPIKVDLASVKV